jgi:hypothetical protein
MAHAAMLPRIATAKVDLDQMLQPAEVSMTVGQGHPAGTRRPDLWNLCGGCDVLCALARIVRARVQS